MQEPCTITLTQWVETFIMVSISDIPTIKYWQTLGSMMDKSKENIFKQYRISDTWFTSLATIGGNLFTRNPNNVIHVHKDSNNLLSVIIILGTNLHGCKTFFNDGDNMNEIERRANVLIIQI